MRAMVKACLAAAAMIALLSATWAIGCRLTDERLDPELQQFTDDFARPAPGREAYAALHAFGEGWVIPDGAEAVVCPKPPGDPCLARVAGSREPLASLLRQMQPQLEQFRTLWTFREFRYTEVPNAASPLARYGALQFMARLVRASIAADALDGHLDAAVDELIRQSGYERLRLAQRGLGLIDKIVAMADLTESALLASELLRSVELAPPHVEALIDAFKPLSPAELSLSGQIDLEAATLARTFLDEPATDRAQNAAAWIRGPHWTGELLARMFYQRNATVNRLFLGTRGYKAFDGLDGAGLKEASSAAPAKVRERMPAPRPAQRLFNPIGVFVTDAVAGPNYVDYMLRLRDVDGMLRIVGLQARIVRSGAADARVSAEIEAAGPAFFDPYNGAPMRWDAQQHTLGFAAANRRIADLLPVAIR